jgi:hypothetical protein
MEKKETSATFEAFRMAKEIAHNEYVDIRAKIHNKWLTESDVEWRAKGVKLPYPDFPSYPSEQEILKRAKNILDFLNLDQPITIITKEETSNVLPLQSSLETIPREVEKPSQPISRSSSLPSLLPQELLSLQPPVADERLLLPGPVVSDIPRKKSDRNLKKDSKTTGGKIVSKLVNKMLIR